ncbi:hypothetical protein [Kribbella hippodromi]|uniref:hypothetical protein n=1 Tax=Kribbella hippodromi TaxID=434347 RepID=UPI0031D70301
MAQVVAAVERRTGRPSSWNRRLYEERSGMGATAQPNGPLSINGPEVLDPLFRAYDATEPLDDWTTRQARAAVLVVVHETDHHQHQGGDQNAPDAVRFDSMECDPVTEGLADSNAHRLLDPVIDDIGMADAFPRIHEVDVVSSYTGYQAGVEGVLDGLQRISGRPWDEVHAAVDSAPFVQRYNAMADVVIDSRLDGLMPPEHRSQLRLVLGQPLREELGLLAEYDLAHVVPDLLADRGQESGAKAVQRLEQEVQAVEQHYRRYGDNAPRMRMNAHEVALLQRIESHYGRSTADLEVSHLRELMDEQRAGWTPGGGWGTGKPKSWAGAPVSNLHRASRRPQPDQPSRRTD